MWSRTWRLDFWERIGISERIGKQDWWPHFGTSAQHPKVGRNDPCPCGAGKKYKCCGGATVN
jgi:uncharacterized protein YchJ